MNDGLPDIDYAALGVNVGGEGDYDLSAIASDGVGMDAAFVNRGLPRTANRVKVASLQDLKPFVRIGADTLIHTSTQDLWAIAQEGSEVVIERLFVDDGNPLKGLAMRTRTASATEQLPPSPDGFTQPKGETPGLKRSIPKDFTFDAKALKPLARAVWASSVALGHALAAYRAFNRVKSASVSPDGMMGGRGYIMKVPDIRQRLFEACESLSSIIDTLHDEVNAPHWKPRLADLGANDAEDVLRLLDEADESMKDPEAEANDEIEELEEENDGPGGTTNEKRWGDSPEPKNKEDASQVPGVGNVPDADAPKRSWGKKEANSAFPVNSLPGGPRVNHLDRGFQEGPGGSYNEDERPSQQDWQATRLQKTDENKAPKVYQANDLAWKVADSAVPNYLQDATPTQTDDYGLGYGAEGQAFEKTKDNSPPNGKGVLGPASEVPSGTRTPNPKDWKSDTTLTVETAVGSPMPRGANSKVPNDNQPPVARSDYYRGTGPSPLIAESEVPTPESNMPNIDKDTPGLGYKAPQMDTPYARYESTYHDRKKDPNTTRERT